MIDSPLLHDRGRGPEIKGTRITVYAMFELIEQGWSAERLAEFFQVSVPQATAVIEYVRTNHAEVKSDFEQIRARHARGNPPHLQARLAKSRQQFLSRLTDAQRRRWEELNGERATG